MNIIAFDTSADVLCVALLIQAAGNNDERRCLEISIDDGLRHAELLTEAVEGLCEQAGLDRHSIQGVVCGRGPGSFTGLRIGMANAKGMATALACPLSSVSALDAMAWRHRHWPGAVIPVLDARKNRFYTAFYFQGERLSEYSDLAADHFDAWVSQHTRTEFQHAPVLWTGPDARLLTERLVALADTGNQHFSHSAALDSSYRKGWGLEMAEIGWRRIAAGNWDTPETGPEYVRASDAELSITRKVP